jgi:hypothetical protein
MATKIGKAIKDILDTMPNTAPNTGENTPNSPNPTQTFKTTGGITVSRDLLPDVAEGDTVTLKVVSVDETKNEVHLTKEEQTEATPPPETPPAAG